jgi:hypothetical protein
MAKNRAIGSEGSVPVKQQPQSAARQKVPSAGFVSMQFKIPAEFVRAFKVKAASNDMKLNELFKACFDAFMKTKS